MRDKRVLLSHPLKIENRIQQIAVKEYKRITKDLEGEEREEKIYLHKFDVYPRFSV